MHLTLIYDFIVKLIQLADNMHFYNDGMASSSLYTYRN